MRRLLMIELSWAFSRAFTKLGIAIAASNPMMATTIMISTSVNAAFLFVLICITIFVFVCPNARREHRKRLVSIITYSNSRIAFCNCAGVTIADVMPQSISFEITLGLWLGA